MILHHVSGAVLGAGAAITSKLAQLQETARSLAVPDHVRANISANLANARDLMGLGDGAGPDAEGAAGPAEAPQASPGRLEPIAEQPVGGGAGPAAVDTAPSSRSVLCPALTAVPLLTEPNFRVPTVPRSMILARTFC